VLLLILVVAVLISRKRPLISYCIIFFFLNHLIEGSFISLGLVYEHRNYLPSMLLFVPLSIFIVYSLDYFRERKRMIVVLSSAITAIIIIMGMTVYTYNGILKDEISLWSNNAEKTPHLAIVHNSLGAAFLTAGRLSNAFTELTKATESFNREHADVEYMTYRLLGYYYIVGRDDEKALFYTKKALAAFPSDAELRNELAAIFMKKKKLGEAESEMKKAISLRKDKASFHINLGKIYLLRGHLDAAIKSAQRGIFLDGNPLEAYWLMSEAFKEKRDYRMSAHFSSLASGFKLAEKRCP
jgi:tetratricopeptide (TPR) repeat protein